MSLKKMGRSPHERPSNYKSCQQRQKYYATNLPSWEIIFNRIGEKPPRRNRARCPFHGGDSLLSLSIDENKGVFHCFVCHESGDKITFIRKLYKCDFKEALLFFGLTQGNIRPKLDPELVKRNLINQAFRDDCKTKSKRVCDLIFSLNQTEVRALERLENDSSDEIAYFIFYEVTSKLLPKYEAIHDMLLSKDIAEKLEALRYLRKGRL